MSKTDRPQDNLYANPLAEIVDFEFDESVTHVFADMINRSVPGYGTIITMLGIIADKYAQANSHLYDLGCSLGASSLSMQQHIQQPGCTIYAVDNAAAMIEKLTERLKNIDNKTPIIPICTNLQSVEFTQASVVVLNFTLQFIPAAERTAILQKIYQGMLPGGIIVLSEKLVNPDKQQEQTIVNLHHHFKRKQGYSELEISQKRIALENSLLPETLEAHLSRLQNVGFKHCQQWFQCFNFASIIALK